MRKMSVGNYEIPKHIADRFKALIRDLGFHEVSVIPLTCGHYEVAYFGDDIMKKTEIQRYAERMLR